MTTVRVIMPNEWVQFFRRNLVSPVEFGGALDFTGADSSAPGERVVDSAAVTIGEERSVSLVNRREEIGIHIHPLSPSTVFAPSGKDYAALLSAASRYYGGTSAPNQQVSVVVAGNGVYALRPTDELMRRLNDLLNSLRAPPAAPLGRTAIGAARGRRGAAAASRGDAGWAGWRRLERAQQEGLRESSRLSQARARRPRSWCMRS